MVRLPCPPVWHAASCFLLKTSQVPTTNWHLPSASWQGLSHEPLQPLTFSTPRNELRVEISNEALCALEQTGRRALHKGQYFQEKIYEPKFLHRLIPRKALKSLTMTSAPRDKQQASAKMCVWLQVPPGSSDGRVCLQCGRPWFHPGLERSLGEGNGNPLQYACLEKPMDGGTWQATVHGVAKSRTRLSNFAHFDSITKVIYNTDISL